jgi:hypothetical protein
MTHDSSISQPISLKDETTLVVAESKSFVDFDQWMDCQLEQLVAQWIHTAAPNAQRADRHSRRFSK